MSLKMNLFSPLHDIAEKLLSWR